MEPATKAKIQSSLSLVGALLFSIATLAAIHCFLGATFRAGEVPDDRLTPVLLKCAGIFFPLTVIGAFTVARGWHGPPAILAVVAGLRYYYLGLFTYLRGGLLLPGLIASFYYCLVSMGVTERRLRAASPQAGQEPAIP
jgi:hypothetical protein